MPSDTTSLREIYDDERDEQIARLTAENERLTQERDKWKDCYEKTRGQMGCIAAWADEYREALDAALDGVVAALERDEQAAKAEYEAARERYRTVRQAAAEMRAMRAMVKVEPVEISGGGPAVETPPSATGAKRWARDFDACTNCGTTDSPHQGKGECARCTQYRRTHGHARPKSFGGGAA